MKWVYILKCSDDHYYVGETKRLYRRFWEHQKGSGGVNTSIYIPEELVAIYKVSTLCKFFEYNHIVTDNIVNIYFNRAATIMKEFEDDIDEDVDNYDNLYAENNITECLMLNTNNWQKIRGGKYNRLDIEYTLPINNYIKNLPLCSCGLPCDIKKKDNYFYFRCSKKNMWSGLKELFDVDTEPCKYFMKYIKDVEYMLYYEKKKKSIFNLVSKSPWLNNLSGWHEYCIGDCGKEYDENNTIRFKKATNLCFECFTNKNDELSKKYTEGCLISLPKR
jgi:hypothetical protein